MEFAEANRCGLKVLVLLANLGASWSAEAITPLKDDPTIVDWHPRTYARDDYPFGDAAAF
jgi:hypothetical protein